METAAFGFGINPHGDEADVSEQIFDVASHRQTCETRCPMSSSVPADAQWAGPGQRTRSSEVDGVIRTVDLVITGAGSGALAAAADALQRGRRVLVLLRPGDARVGQRFRRCLCKAANVNDTQVTVMTNAEVVCMDGVNGVEAVASAMRGPTAVRRKRVRLPVVPTARRSRHVSTDARNR
jgi:predicted dinucleotide-utilizing enzyme